MKIKENRPWTASIVWINSEGKFEGNDRHNRYETREEALARAKQLKDSAEARGFTVVQACARSSVI